jgi:hypothetical protein
MNRHKFVRELELRGVPETDGTPIGNLKHTIAVYSETPDDTKLLVATSYVYGDDIVTGLTFGDLRALLQMIEEKDMSVGEQFGNRMMNRFHELKAQGRVLLYNSDFIDVVDSLGWSRDTIQVFFRQLESLGVVSQTPDGFIILENRSS